ncbi:MAG: hypothetical protein DMG04_06140 [Acidobacteria bacterium]|nr:MAG: hypothetical protein DMG04_06140 [Acidobacteriota bacterium]PYR13846.1 MAG: hypothetical protein DMF99_00300 [Acidobacteriota bacterium]
MSSRLHGSEEALAMFACARARTLEAPCCPLARYPLKDKRVVIEVGDVAAPLRASRGRFDAVLLDVDTGPAVFTASRNADLYDDHGLAAARSALKPGGVLAVWSAREDRRFEQRLRAGSFDVTVERVRGRLKKGGPEERHLPRSAPSNSA